MNIAIILLNVYYTGVAVALLVHDIFWLRVIMLAAQGSMIAYGMFIGNNIIVIWNGLFVSINLIQSVRLILERRPVSVDEEIQDIYENIFYDMTEKEFNYFWKRGTETRHANQVVCHAGDVQDRLLLVLSGVALVVRDDREIANLVRGNFIGEKRKNSAD